MCQSLETDLRNLQNGFNRSFYFIFCCLFYCLENKELFGFSIFHPPLKTKHPTWIIYSFFPFPLAVRPNNLRLFSPIKDLPTQQCGTDAVPSSRAKESCIHSRFSLFEFLPSLRSFSRGVSVASVSDWNDFPPELKFTLVLFTSDFITLGVNKHHQLWLNKLKHTTVFSLTAAAYFGTPDTFCLH